ncbi:MAG: class I SAM-dependent methyltransferase [Patescibacteria group bacterium]
MQCGVCLRETACTQRETYREFSLWECAQCSGQFWNPMTNPGAAWYEKDERYSDRNAAPLRRPVHTHRAFLDENPAPGGRVLDVGMGTGNFLSAAKQKGYEVWGIDFDRDAIAVAREQFGLEHVHVASLEQLREQFPDKQFNAITLFEVLEHVESPSALMQSIHSALADGGYVAISVPYRRGSRLLMPADLPPRHLTRWNRAAMRNLLEQHGFEVVRFRCFAASLTYVVTKFHFWTRGYLSFGLVNKLKRRTMASSTTGAAAPQSAGATSVRPARSVSALFILAKTKDYVLFTIPALVLMAYLAMRGELRISLYALARKKSTV